jgi:uncharacterized membrane protein
MPEPSTGLTLDARFAAATTELVARVTVRTAIVGVYLTAAGALLAAISGTSWLPLAVPYVGAAATWLIFIEDNYIYRLVDFLARCEDEAVERPDLRYSTGTWMATNIKRQWRWWYPIFGAVVVGLNLVAWFAAVHLRCNALVLGLFLIATALSGLALYGSFRSGQSAHKEMVRRQKAAGVGAANGGPAGSAAGATTVSPGITNTGNSA